MYTVRSRMETAVDFNNHTNCEDDSKYSSECIKTLALISASCGES